MNPNLSRSLLAIIVFGLFLPDFAVARSLDEDTALNLLLRTLKRDNVYVKRISLDCVTFETEETAKEYFQFVLRENHTEKCGGDPDVSPVVDRYRVHRGSRKIELYDAAKDSWGPYDPAKAR